MRRNKMDYFYWLYKDSIPEGYITGLARGSPNPQHDCVAHLYKGTFNNPGNPMCKYGWNKKEYGYSIWRNNIGRKGICKICLRRVNEHRSSIRFPYKEK